MSSDKLLGMTAIVTGGGHGIGREYCKRYAQEGASIAVLDLDEAGAQKVAHEIANNGNKAIPVKVDVSDESSVRHAVDVVLEEFHGIDILVNNAAMFSVVAMSRCPFDEISVDEWDRMMSINVKGTWLMCREVAQHMRKKSYGKIINVSSGSVFKGTRTQIHYVTSKAAVYGFTHTLARELGPHGINVNTIAPGSTLSEESPSEQVLQMREETAKTRAISRVQLPTDVVGTAVFLASADSDFMTGQTLVVDGGAYMS